jgi:hypothetical protein
MDIPQFLMGDECVVLTLEMLYTVLYTIFLVWIHFRFLDYAPRSGIAESWKLYVELTHLVFISDHFFNTLS